MRDKDKGADVAKRVRLVLTDDGTPGKVELDGLDISQYVTKVEVRFDKGATIWPCIRLEMICPIDLEMRALVSSTFKMNDTTAIGDGDWRAKSLVTK